MLDESLLENSISKKTPSVNLDIGKEAEKEPAAVLPDTKKRKRAPLIGVIAASLIAGFGAVVLINDQ